MGSIREGKGIFEGHDLKPVCPVGARSGERVLGSGQFVHCLLPVWWGLFLGHSASLAYSAPKPRVEPQAEVVIQSLR